MIQIPLSRLSSAFSFLTAFIGWLLDYKTKQDIYNCLQYFFWRLANPVKKPIRAESGGSPDLPSFS
jgi:hypothetical protein